MKDVFSLLAVTPKMLQRLPVCQQLVQTPGIKTSGKQNRKQEDRCSHSGMGNPIVLLLSTTHAAIMEHTFSGTYLSHREYTTVNTLFQTNLAKNISKGNGMEQKVLSLLTPKNFCLSVCKSFSAQLYLPAPPPPPHRPFPLLFLMQTIIELPIK